MCRRQSTRYRIGGGKRIYLVHIRKTGGTSLNHAFLQTSGMDSSLLYEQLVQKKDHRVCCGDKVFVGWNIKHINAGHYYYAFSHTPLHQIGSA
ncbi:hypothetical protein Poly24_32500 [Rosistilla carotiformis]|uniref:Uncharacterized protein n=1 Tax=Rosistilla carotiformis TaxID=2528017 RepID=A0A518JVG0_9BACT|nr:hypothetical protein Poly24_32500 [Rosistilla carotiformis]